MNNLRRYISHIGVFNTVVIYYNDDYQGWVTCFYPCIRYSNGYYKVYNEAGEVVAYCENELEARMIYYRLLFRDGGFGGFSLQLTNFNNDVYGEPVLFYNE